VNEDGARPARFLPSADRSRSSLAGTAVAELAFFLPDLPEVRDFAAAQAVRGGMPEEDLADFLVAVNEVATNAVTHGHPTAKAVLRMWNVGRTLAVEIHDEGRWNPGPAPGETPPAPHATSGMGLWVARMVSSDITFETGASGTFITMFFKV
jgi:serine/threonine-protein kinase RsbW